MSQTSYSQYQAAAFAGMLADSTERDVDSYSCEAAAIPFGVPLILGTNKERQVKQAATGAGAGALVTGFSVASHTVEQTAAGVAQYAVGVTVPRLKKGRIWVNTDDAVVAGAVANLKLSSGLLTDEAVATGIEAITQLSVKFVTGTTAAGLAMIEVK